MSSKETHPRRSILVVTLLFVSIASLFAAEVTEISFSLPPGEIELAPSFEACSYYFRPEGAVERTYIVEFRRVGDAAWQRAFEPVSDKPAGIWKGSVFNLPEDTVFQLRVFTAAGAEIVRPVEFRTWSSHPPIAKTIDLSTLPSAAQGLVIADQGSPDGWIKYTAPRGWRVQRPEAANDSETAAITFRRARYVILEGVTIVGGARHGVLVEESESVRILNCDISGWGRVGVQQFTNTETRGKYNDARGSTINYDAGVSVGRSARTVVERCYIHDPRHRANSWMFSHPAGPTAMHMNATRGGNVVRWNDFVGSDEHRFNDVIEASSNGSADGGFFRDSDISGNFLAFGNDDGVELEGGGMNVRFYRNRIEGTLCGVSTAACLLGPQFVFGNLIANPGDETGLALMFFKNSHGVEQGGKRHFINNTLYGPASPYGSYGKPIGSERIGFMRNNIFVGNDGRAPGDWARRDDFDYDLFWANGNAAASGAFLEGMRRIGQEAHGVALNPQVADPGQGDFHLAADSVARGRTGAVANLVSAGANPGAFADDATEVPFRPLALTAVPRLLEFGEPAPNARMQVTLTVPASAKEPVAFEIKKNRVFTWFDVQPASGTVAPGKTLTLTVTVDAATLQGRPRFKGAFLVRTPSGLSRPVSVYATGKFREELRPADAPNTAFVELAALPSTENLVRTTGAPGVYGGKYLALTGSERGPEFDARIVVPRAGKYSLLMRASVAGEASGNSNFAITVDDATAPAAVSVHHGYQWSAGAKNFRAVYLHALGELAAGEHRLRVRLLAGKLNLNELIVTENPAAFFIDHWQKERN